MFFDMRVCLAVFFFFFFLAADQRGRLEHRYAHFVFVVYKHVILKI